MESRGASIKRLERLRIQVSIANGLINFKRITGPIKDEYDDDSVHDDVADMFPEWS